MFRSSSLRFLQSVQLSSSVAATRGTCQCPAASLQLRPSSRRFGSEMHLMREQSHAETPENSNEQIVKKTFSLAQEQFYDRVMQRAHKSFFNILAQPEAQTEAEAARQKEKFIEVINKYYHNNQMRATQYQFRQLSEALQNREIAEGPTALDLALFAYLNLMTFSGFAKWSNAFFDGVENEYLPEVPAQHVKRVLQLLKGEKLHANTIMFFLGKINHARKTDSFSQYTPAIIQGLVSTLVFDDELGSGVLTEKQRLDIAGMAMVSLEKCTHTSDKLKAHVYALADRAIDQFNDVDAIRECVLRYCMVHMITPHTFDASLALVQKFEQKFQDYEIDPVIIYSLFLQGSRIEDQYMREQALATLRNYIFGWRPRRTYTALTLIVLTEYDLNAAIEARQKLDTVSMDQVIWDGELIVKMMVRACQQQNHLDFVQSTVQTLVSRWNQNTVDMTKPPYLLWKTEAQREKLKKKAGKVIWKELSEFLLKQENACSLETRQQILAGWVHLMRHQQTEVKYKKNGGTEKIFVAVHAPLKEDTLQVRLPILDVSVGLHEEDSDNGTTIASAVSQQDAGRSAVEWLPKAPVIEFRPKQANQGQNHTSTVNATSSNGAHHRRGRPYRGGVQRGSKEQRPSVVGSSEKQL